MKARSKLTATLEKRRPVLPKRAPSSEPAPEQGLSPASLAPTSIAAREDASSHAPKNAPTNASAESTQLFLLTWHGTIVWEGTELHEFTQMEIAPDAPPDAALRLTLTPRLPEKTAEEGWWVGLPGQALSIQPSRSIPSAGIIKQAGSPFIHLQHARKYLCALDQPPSVAWVRERAEIWETFLPLTRPEYDRLVLLVGQVWREQTDDGDAAPAERAQMLDGFRVKLGERITPLLDVLSSWTIETATGPEAAQAHQLRLGRGSTAPMFRSLHQSDPGVVGEILLHELRADFMPRRVDDFATFSTTPDSALELASPEATSLRPPVTVSPLDDQLFRERYYQGRVPPLDPQIFRCSLRRESNKWVVLSRLGEGVIFDERGSSNSWGFLNNLPRVPAYLKRRGGRITLYPDIVSRTARRVQKQLVVFYNGNLHNYYHWIVEAMLSLDIISRYQVPGFYLLLPPALQQHGAIDHCDIMNTLGFGDIPSYWCDDTLIRVEEVMWVEGGGLIEEVPPEHVQAFNRRIAERFDVDGMPRSRIYVRRSGSRGLANSEEVEKQVLDWGFTPCSLEELSFRDQILLFRRAEFVIAPHGAGLSNLIFCPATAKVIEFMPEVEMRPFYWLLSAKLGLTYGLLHCAMIDPGNEPNPFNRRMHVDLARLDALFRKLETECPERAPAGVRAPGTT